MNMTSTLPAIDISNYEALRPHLGLRLANRLYEQRLIDDCPGDSYLDLATLPYLMLDVPDSPPDGAHIMHVRWDMVRTWGITAEKLMTDAALNMPFLLPPCLQTLEETLQAHMDPDEPMMSLDPEEDFSCGLYVLTNKRAIYGASCILYPGLMEEIYRCLGAYYVLPCSVHEVIIAPDHEALTPTGLADIVHSVNREMLDQDDYLSDNIYYCGEQGLSLVTSDFSSERA